MKFYMMQIASIGLVALALTGSTHASSVTIGPNGINSDGLTLVGGTALTGSGIGIGQVELARPGKRVVDGGFDNAANSNATIVPADVFVRTTGGAGIANMNTSNHAQQVAGLVPMLTAMRMAMATPMDTISCNGNVGWEQVLRHLLRPPVPCPSRPSLLLRFDGGTGVSHATPAKTSLNGKVTSYERQKSQTVNLHFAIYV